MTNIHPFHGNRYNPEHPEVQKDGASTDLSHLITQPYDKISDEMREVYYEQSPKNYVRLILNRGETDEGLPGDPYQNAAQLLQQWTEEEVFARDPDPSIYVFQSTFTDGNGRTRQRTGFFSLFDIEEYGEGGIHAHEHTMSGPKADRLNLLRATRANLEPIFLLYPGEERGESRIQQILEEATDSEPLATAEIEGEGQHAIWAISDRSDVRVLQRELDNRELVIADGHHRYETALNYYHELQEQDDPAAEQARSRLAVFVSSKDPGLFIYPSHRVVLGLEGFDADTFRDRLHDAYEVIEYPMAFDREESAQRQFEVLLEDIRFEGIDQHAFGVVTPGDESILLVKIQNETVLEEGVYTEDHSDAWKSLDVNILGKLILEDRLGITPDMVEAGQHLSYHRHAKDVISRVQGGDAQVGFLLNPTEVGEVLTVAQSGERMPQKSTDFYPKIPSGFVFSRIDKE